MARRANKNTKTDAVKDRISEIRISGMRSIEKATIHVDDLTVLLGENGSGKSTIVEACELLHQAHRHDFLDAFHKIHAGFTSLGSDILHLGVSISGGGPKIHYDFRLLREGTQTKVASEDLRVGTGKRGETILSRKHSGTVEFLNPKRDRITAEETLHTPGLLLPMLSTREEQKGLYSRTVNALRGIDVQVPFDVIPQWVRKTYGRPSGMRGSVSVRPVQRMELLGNDLANVYFSLKNERPPEHWSETLDYIRLGLGDEVSDVSTAGDPGGGEIALNITFKGSRQAEPAMAMSDGMLAYLALVAVFRLVDQRSLLVFDEPDLHLHPHLLRLVVGFCETAARSHPVMLATQSDQLLDALSHPERSALLCRLDEKRRTRLYRPDTKALARWLERYRGLGDLRNEGYEDFVVGKEEN